MSAKDAPQPMSEAMGALDAAATQIKDASSLDQPAGNRRPKIMDVYKTMLTLEAAANAVSKVTVESHHNFPSDREARERAIGQSVSESLGPVGVNRRTIDRISSNVSRQLTAATCQSYQVASIINEAILIEVEQRAEDND